MSAEHILDIALSISSKIVITGLVITGGVHWLIYLLEIVIPLADQTIEALLSIRNRLQQLWASLKARILATRRYIFIIATRRVIGILQRQLQQDKPVITPYLRWVKVYYKIRILKIAGRHWSRIGRTLQNLKRQSQGIFTTAIEARRLYGANISARQYVILSQQFATLGALCSYYRIRPFYPRQAELRTHWISDSDGEQ